LIPLLVSCVTDGVWLSVYVEARRNVQGYDSVEHDHGRVQASRSAGRSKKGLTDWLIVD